VREARFTQLDALRAFAVTAVVATHTLGPWAATGTTGVQLFFVISGFLITGILLDARAQADELGQPRTSVLRSFYARRALRIFPIYYLTIAIGTLIGVPPMRESLSWNLLFLSNWKIASDGDWGVVPHIWSLAVEEQFYLVWPLIMLFAPRKVLPWAIGAMIFIAPATRMALVAFTDVWPDGVVIVTPATFDALGLGALLALLWRTSHNVDRVDRVAAWLAVGAVVFFVLRFATVHWLPEHAVLWQLTVARWPLLFAWCVHRVARGVRGPLGAFLLWRPIVYIGTISYGIYLVHLFVLPVGAYLEGLIGLHVAFPPRGAARFILVSAASIGLASFSWRFIERPINNLKRHFPYVRTDVIDRSLEERVPATTVLVTGATGFVGNRLLPRLVEQGFTVRAMSRNPDRYNGGHERVVRGDVDDPLSLPAALAGIDVAFYLIHSLGDPDFERRDAAAARSFGAAAARAGVRQIVYLGGLGADDVTLSPHLRSRREVEEILGEAGVPVTVLRAAIVVGSGGVSWELTRQLVKKLPAMVVPKWVSTRTQPIALDDVVRYLAGVIDHPDALGRVFEIGGAEQLTYLEMLQVAAEISKGSRVPIVRVPVLTPRLSSYWLALVTDVDVTTGRNLIDSMRTEVVVTDFAIRDLVPGEPMSYAESVRLALEESERLTGQAKSSGSVTSIASAHVT
jgi:peptidoglycan/LPS O-acetylase OafA/YrhL/uncharacterized protein YbjT (DUF2867 family)